MTAELLVACAIVCAGDAESERNLRRLQMAHTGVTDAGLDQLQALSSLEDLNLRGTKVTKDGLNKLKQRLPKVQTSGQ